MAETTETKKGTFPKSVPYIIGNEIAERFSFYGLRAILPTFLVAHFFNPSNNPALSKIADAQQNEVNHLFVTLAYFSPLIGGILADWFFGKYKIILWVSIFYTFGHLMLSLSINNYTFFFVGLVIVALCAGGVKSCVSANVGDQFDKSNEHLLSKMYGWFYMAINIGGTAAPILVPLFKTWFSDEVAFAVPGILMALATIIFFIGRKKYNRVPPTGIKRQNFVTISLYALAKSFSRKPGQKVWEAVAEKYSQESIDGVKSIYRILAVFAFTPVYWALWDQNLSEWILQARSMDRTIFGSITLMPDQINFVNPLFVVALIPFYTYVVYPFFERRGLKPTPLRRIGAGMVIIGLTFVVIALIQKSIDNGGHPSVWWQIFAYVLLASSEILVSVTCLEYAYTHSLPSMKSTASALYLLGISLGSLFVSLVNGSIASGGFFSKFTGASYYWLFIGILAVFIVIYLVVSRRLPEKSYVGVKPGENNG